MIAALLFFAAIASPFANLSFRNIGPDIGRVDAVAGVPGSSTLFAGGLGGLWRTTDEGATWTPVFENQAVSSIGAIAVAPSNSNIVYAGTGEPNIRNDIAFGDGMWRSRDGGKTWTHIGLDQTSQIAQIAIDPKDANVVYVAAVGDPFIDGSAARGVYKTTDGGARWRRVLHIDEATGASSVVIDPADSCHLFAGLWNIRRKPWFMQSGGDPADGLYESHDAGVSWAKLNGNGLPGGPMGRIGLAFAKDKSKRVYALIESRSGVLWRSEDGGKHWTLTNRDHQLAQRPYYFSQLTVDPANADHVFFLSVYPMVSYDGGRTAKRLHTGLIADHHQLWIDPSNPSRMIVGADFGAAISHDRGKHWRRSHLLNGQSYRVDISDEIPYTVCAEFQDPGAACGPSYSFSGTITGAEWAGPLSGESGWISFDPADNSKIYGTGDSGYVVEFDRNSLQSRNILPWPIETSGAGASAARYRAAWVSPLIVSSFEPHAVYFGANVLFKSTDGGMTWHTISDDLTRDDKSKQVSSGGPITTDNAGTEYYDTISTISESPFAKGTLWVGTDDGLVWHTSDDGAHWANVTANVPGLAKWERINSIEPSWFDAATAYMAVDEHKLGDRRPMVYVTHDNGAHWASIASNLPVDSYARIVREDPVRRNMLYLGTESGLWYSFDGGASWQRMNGIPQVPVYDVKVQRRFNDLVVGTHGRSIWILDDLSPYQQFTSSVGSSAMHLFTVRSAYRWSGSVGTWATYGSVEGAGDNPVFGADIDFYLKAAPKKGESVRLQISDATGVVNTITPDHLQAGINRVYWDLTVHPWTPPAMLKPDTDGGFSAPLGSPGTYTVRLTYDGKTQEQPIQVLADPRSHYSATDIAAQNAFLMRLRGDVVKVADTIVTLSATQKQHPSPKLQAALETLYQPKLRHWRDDLRYPPGLYEEFSTLTGLVQGSDARPPQSFLDAASCLEQRLNQVLNTVNAAPPR